MVGHLLNFHSCQWVSGFSSACISLLAGDPKIPGPYQPLNQARVLPPRKNTFISWRLGSGLTLPRNQFWALLGLNSTLKPGLQYELNHPSGKVSKYPEQYPENSEKYYGDLKKSPHLTTKRPSLNSLITLLKKCVTLESWLIRTARVEKLLLKYILQNHKFFKKSTLQWNGPLDNSWQLPGS